MMALHSDGSLGVLAGKPAQRGKADGRGAAARFFNSTSLAFDGVRYLYVADTGNQFIRRVDVLTKEVVTVAGCRCNNSQGFRDGPGVVATFSLPRGVAVDSWGDLYVADEQNSAVRVVRIVTDPARDPQIRRFEPYALLRGSQARLTVSGENLGLTQTASLGAGIQVKIASQSSRTLQLDVTISPTAPVGSHTLRVKTFYGKVDTPPGLTLQVLDQNEAQTTVSTIAGTGSWAPGVHDGPAI